MNIPPFHFFVLAFKVLHHHSMIFSKEIGQRKTPDFHDFPGLNWIFV